jgi:hypothetical protein
MRVIAESEKKDGVRLHFVTLFSESGQDQKLVDALFTVFKVHRSLTIKVSIIQDVDEEFRSLRIEER